MKFNKNWSEKKWVPYTIATCSAVVLYMLLSHFEDVAGFFEGVWRVIGPVIGGVIFAYLIDPIARFFSNTIFKKFKKKNVARSISIFLAFVCVIAAVILLFVALIPQIVESISGVINSIGNPMNSSLEQSLVNWLSKVSGGLIDVAMVTKMFEGAVGIISNSILSWLTSILSASYSLGSSLISVLIAFILAIYFMMDKDKLTDGIARLGAAVMKPAAYKTVADFMSRCDKILLRYIKCSFLEAVIVGLVNSIFMMIVGMPYVVLVSVVIGLTNLAPTIGPIVGAIIGGILIAINNPWHALWFLIFSVVLQTIDGYIIKPKLFGDTLGVSSLLILITIIVGGRLFGILGILLAIPFAAILQYLVKEILTHRAANKAKAVTEEESN